MTQINISGFKKSYAKYFYQLNKDWITKYWELEQSDLNDLLEPERFIINKGGEIFFCIINNKPVATVAIIPGHKKTYELAKMTVGKKFRGKGYSKLLLNKCIDFVRQNDGEEIYLISNNKLKIARKLYDNYGFIEVKLDSKKYKRGNIKMVLSLQ